MNEKQFPQTPIELVSRCLFTLDMFQAIMEMEEMCQFENFSDLYFLVKPDCQAEIDSRKFFVHFITDKDQ